MVWDETSIQFSVDDIEIYTYSPIFKTPDTWPFDKEQYMLLNVAIESTVDPTFTESSMQIDYVRIYDSNEDLVWSDEFSNVADAIQVRTNCSEVASLHKANTCCGDSDKQISVTLGAIQRTEVAVLQNYQQ